MASSRGILLQVAAATRPAASTFAHFRRRHGRRHPSTDRGRRRAHLRRRWHRQRFMLHTCSDRVSNNPLHSILLRSSRSPVSATASCLLGVAHKPIAHPAIFAPPVAWHCLEPTKWTIPVLHGMLHPHLILVFTPRRLWASWGCMWRSTPLVRRESGDERIRKGLEESPRVRVRVSSWRWRR